MCLSCCSDKGGDLGKAKMRRESPTLIPYLIPSFPFLQARDAVCRARGEGLVAAKSRYLGLHDSRLQNRRRFRW